MFSVEEADGWIGRTAVDSSGEQVGMITQIWVDDASGRPEWASIKSAVLGWREALVPLAGSADLGGGRQFAYSKQQLAGAPQVAQDGRLDPGDRDRVASYYGVPQRIEPAAAASDDGPSESDMAASLTDADPAPPQASRRFRRTPKPSAPRSKRRFGRKPTASDQEAAEATAPPEQVPVSG